MLQLTCVEQQCITIGAYYLTRKTYVILAIVVDVAKIVYRMAEKV